MPRLARQPERAAVALRRGSAEPEPPPPNFVPLCPASLTHLGEDGWSAPMLMALSGHDNLLTLGIYVHPSAEAVAAALARQDLGRRR